MSNWFKTRNEEEDLYRGLRTRQRIVQLRPKYRHFFDEDL
jgi:hypothetical protein